MIRLVTGEEVEDNLPRFGFSDKKVGRWSFAKQGGFERIRVCLIAAYKQNVILILLSSDFDMFISQIKDLSPEG